MAASSKRKGLLALCAALVMSGALLFASACSQPQPTPEPTPEPAPAPEVLVQVPDLIWLDQADAQKHLTLIGLEVGEVTQDYDENIPAGVVARQSPEPLTALKLGDAVSLVVSKGPKAPTLVTMPDLIGKGQFEAQRELIDLHIIAVREDPIVDTSVAPGKICKQSVAAGTQIPQGSTISFTTAIAEQPVTVPDVRGKTKDEAKAAIEKAELGIDITNAYDDKVEKDKIISQDIEGGKKVAKGTVINLVASLGPKPVEKVKVPDIYTYTLDEAVKALTSAGLKYRYSGDDNGTVSAVDPEVGKEVEVGSTVTFVLQHVATMVKIPDVSNMTGGQAEAILNSMNLSLEYNRRDPEAVISHTQPAAGTLVEEWTVVEAVYPEPEPEPEPEPTPGAWSVNTDATPSITGIEREVFNDAIAQTLGVDYTPIALLATQSTSGTNYAFLCTSGVAGSPSSSWAIVSASVDADENVSLMGINQLSITNLSTTSTDSSLLGGWTVNPGAASVIPGEAQQTFDEAMQGNMGVSASPVALLGTQPVAGTNYMILCVGGAVSPSAPGTIYIVTVTRAASGEASVSSIEALNLSAYIG